jgi:DNA-binding MarR family transcriptional regulator
MENQQEILNDFMNDCFYSILESERKALEFSFPNLTFKDIHLIETVIKASAIGENNFSRVASRLGVTLGTLTAAFTKLEQRGYLVKERYLIDGRVYYIKPTNSAQMVHKEHMEWHERALKKLLTFIPKKNVDIFINVLKDLSKAYKFN